MKRVQRTFTVEYKSGRRKLGTQPSSIWGNMDLKSVAQAVENEGAFSPNPLADASERDASVMPGAQRDSDCLMEETASPADGQAMPVASESEPASQVEAPAVAEVAPSSPEQGIRDTVHHAAKPDVAAEASIVADDARRSNKQSDRSNRIAGDEGDQPTSAKRAPRNLQAAKVQLTSASDERAELAELEAENSRLRTLLAEKLCAENAILRTMLQVE